MILFTQLLIHITGKPVQPEDLRKIESIVNQQIKDELGVYALEIKLEDAKRINGLRAVFGEVGFLAHAMLIFLV
jgi:alanyl-tRNA synthetase